MFQARSWVFGVLLACGGSAATTSTSAPTAALPTPAVNDGLAVVAMKAAVGRHTLEVRPEGDVLFDDQPMGKIVGYEVKDATGATVVRVETDGALTLKGKPGGAKFDASDVLSWTDGSKMSMLDDGVLTAMRSDGKPDPDRIQFVGFKPSARRTAIAVFIAAHLLH